MSYLDGVDFGQDLIGVRSDDIHPATDQMQMDRNMVPSPPKRATHVDAVRAAVNSGGPSWSDVITPTAEGFGAPPMLIGKSHVVMDRDMFNMVVFLIVAVIIYLMIRNNQMEKNQLAMMMNMIVGQQMRPANQP